MTYFYRFRSVEQLLGEYSELENQTIFFASLEDLNDPMEGFRDIVWSGDRIVWLNLFKDYINCLFWGHHYVVVAGPKFPYELPVRQAWTWNCAPSPQASDRLIAIWERAQDELQLRQFATSLEELGRKVRKDELVHFLKTINLSVSMMILESFFDNNMLQRPDGYDHAFETQPLTVPSLPEGTDDAPLDAVYEVIHASLSVYSASNVLLLDHVNDFDENDVLQRNWDRLRFDFPEIYVGELSHLIQPNWYVACFTKTPHSSSMWSHYGDGHRGVCLIFEAEDGNPGDADKSETPTISLHQITGWGWNERDGSRDSWGFAPVPFCEVQYADRPAEVNFFTEMGNITGQDLLDLWYTDEVGNVSGLAGHVTDEHNREVWRQRHWDAFRRDLAFKTREWAYEQEHRLVWYDLFKQTRDEEDRTLTYDFRALAGVIFGTRMLAIDKRRIMAIIADKCQEHNRDSFPFYQAYYSPHRGEICYQTIFNYSADGSHE
ncbi:MAG: DUF2971 domain-containing protein [Chloroflexi bacterium]|nr:DUF2971 domain-containing protein [Chloroflexota bacterium]